MAGCHEKYYKHVFRGFDILLKNIFKKEQLAIWLAVPLCTFAFV
jgi:hypothetical protein